MKNECCADEGNTYCVCSNEVFELASILTEENSLFQAYSPEKALLFLQELYNLSDKFETIFYILFFSVCLICKFLYLQKLLFATVFFSLLLGTGQLRKTISSRAENVFTNILLCS